MTRPNGIATNYSYDKLSHLLSVLHQAGTSTIDGDAYTLDAAGNRTAKTDYLAGVTSNYTYDKIYELTQVMQGTNTTESYSYDPVGNRLSSLGVASYSYNNSNELTSSSSGGYTYDANGNTLMDAAGRSYAWDFENRLKQVTLPNSGGTVTFLYDPFGRRIEKVFTQPTNPPTTTTTIYLYDRENTIETGDQNGNVLSRFVQGESTDEPLAESVIGVTNFYEQDGLGSVTSLTNSSGQLAQTYTYDSFGSLKASSGSIPNPFRFAAREFDSETALYYYRARHYDVTTGRFLTQDPLRFYAGMNFYAYVGNRPLDLLDPFGMKCTQKTPWQLIPNMRPPGSPQPYATVQDGVFWTPVDWDFFAGDGTIWCICDWVAHYVRVRKLYREHYQEGAWFKCTDSCGKPEPDQYKTRTVTKAWEKDVPGTRLWSNEELQVLGPTVQLGSQGGTDPIKNNTTCLACSPAYRP